jgi:hypothetical protein
MNRQETGDRLAAHRDEIREMGVKSLELFGSRVRDEAGAQSDVDLLVEFDKPSGLFHFFAVQHRLEEILGVDEVDLVEKEAVHPALRERIYEEAVRVA